MLDKMKLIIGPLAYDVDNDELLFSYLEEAGEVILNRLYPFRSVRLKEGNAVPDRYKELQVEIAVFLFNKRGIEGESLHSENGVSRSYGGETDIPKHLLLQITPVGRVC